MTFYFELDLDNVKMNHVPNIYVSGQGQLVRKSRSRSRHKPTINCTILGPLNW